MFPAIRSSTQSTSISFLEFSKATHRLAHILRPNRVGEDGEVVAVIINCDSILYLALIAGLARADLVPVLISPRNSPEAIVSMMEKTSSRRIITQNNLGTLVSAVKAQLSEKGVLADVTELPSLETAFPAIKEHDPNQSPEVPPYAPSTRAALPDDLVFYLHSSGSTGFPKPIGQTQKTLLQWCHARTVCKHDLEFTN